MWWKHSIPSILFDSCFWIDFIENSSEHTEFIEEYKKTATFIIPYPSFAEFLNDKPLKNKGKLDAYILLNSQE